MTEPASSHPSRSYFEDGIRRAREEVADAEAALQRARDRLVWWEQGQILYGDDAAKPLSAPVERREQPSPVARTAEQATPVDSGTPLNLREAVLRVFLEHPANGREPALKSAQVIDALTRRDQMPGGRYANTTVRKMLRDLAARGQLEKQATGLFSLNPEVREGGVSALRRETRSPGVLQRDVLDAMRRADRPVTPAEITALVAEAGGIAPKGSSIHNVLAKLREGGLVERIGDGVHQLTPAARQQSLILREDRQ